RRFRICRTVQGPSGFAVTPAMCTYREPASMTNKRYRRWRVTAGVHVEEVAGQHRRCLGAQELPPGGVRLPLRRRGDSPGLKDPADRRGTDPVAQLEQFTLDPLVPPGAVLPREAFNQRAGPGTDRRSACAGR